MLLVVTGVGLLIHIYSVGYMHGESGFTRFFTYMNLFMVSMLLLVMGNNYAVLFIGWEGVGLCSYLLIGYYYDKVSAAKAASKAFVVNRIGDAGFLLAIFLVFVNFKTLDYTKVFAQIGLALHLRWPLRLRFASSWELSANQPRSLSTPGSRTPCKVPRPQRTIHAATM